MEGSRVRVKEEEDSVVKVKQVVEEQATQATARVMEVEVKTSIAEEDVELADTWRI